MFGLWRRHGVWPIGCAFTHDAVRMVQLRGGPDRLTVHAVRCGLGEGYDVGDGGWYHAATATVRRALVGPGFLGRDTVTCLPMAQTRYRHLRIAPMPDAELAPAIQWRTSKVLDWGIEQTCADYFEVGEVTEAGKPRREIIAVAALNQHVEAHTVMVQTTGLRLRAIDVEAAAVARCLATPCNPPQPAEAGAVVGATPRTRFVIDLGHDASVLMIVQHGQPRFIRPLGTGRNKIVAEAAERAGLDREGHDLLWRLIRYGRADETDHPVTVARAQQGLRAACERLADELEHAVRLCVHYLSQARLTALVPQVGCIVGAYRQEAMLLDGLNRTAKIAFHPFADALAPPVRALLDGLPPDAAEDARTAAPPAFDEWLVPIGLGLYGREYVIEEAAA